METGQSSQTAQANENLLKQAAGDVLISSHALPDPQTILEGFERRKTLSPYISFEKLRELLEFLENVVITERLIMPISPLSEKSQKISSDPRRWMDFALFTRAGDLHLSRQDIFNKLSDKGILVEAKLQSEYSTVDDLVTRLMPMSEFLQSEHAQYLATRSKRAKYRMDVAQALTSYWLGRPLYVADFASKAKAPYVLSTEEAERIAGYEREVARVRDWVGRFLLNHLNTGARRELAELIELSSKMVFPETPIASMILEHANSPEQLLDVAIQLRQEFAPYRKAVNQIQHDLLDERLSRKAHLKRVSEVKELAYSLWHTPETGLRATAISVGESIGVMAEPTTPGPLKVITLATKLAAFPVDKLLNFYRQRKIRLLLKAKRSFLRSSDCTARIARIFNVREQVVRECRDLKFARLTPDFEARNPDLASRYYKSNGLLMV